jgi:hypothetical protein
MTKDFPTFDCDALTEPPLIWERAKDFLTRDEPDALVDDLVGCRRPAVDRQWSRRGRARLAAHGRHSRHNAVISNAGRGIKYDNWRGSLPADDRAA